MSVISGTIGAITGADAAQDAADAQFYASKYAADTQWKIYWTQYEAMEPFIQSAEKMIPYTEEAIKRADELGQDYVTALQDYEKMYKTGPGEFEQSDYYKDMQKSMDYAISTAGREMATAGSASGAGYGRDLMNYAVPMAEQTYNQGRSNWINEWLATQLNPAQTYMAQLGGTSLPQNAGMNVIPSLVNAGSSAASGISQAALAGGQAQAAGILGQQQALMQGIGGASNALGMGMGLLNGMGGTGTPITGASSIYNPSTFSIGQMAVPGYEDLLSLF